MCSFKRTKSKHFPTHFYERTHNRGDVVGVGCDVTVDELLGRIYLDGMKWVRRLQTNEELKGLSKEEIKQLKAEIRKKFIESNFKGGPEANLGPFYKPKEESNTGNKVAKAATTATIAAGSFLCGFTKALLKKK